MGNRIYDVVILEDEDASLMALKTLLAQSSHASSLRIRHARTITELERMARSSQIDILFSDICLEEGQNAGIQAVARLFPEGSNTQVIYVSGYSDQQLEAYETQHVWFLAKPVDPEKLQHALDKAIRLLDHFSKKTLRIVVDRKANEINIASIRYVESSLRKVRFHLSTANQPLEAYGKLSEMADRLGYPFMRCHGSYVVNLAYVSRVTTGYCELIDGSHVPVSRSRLDDTKAAFAHYLRDRI